MALFVAIPERALSIESKRKSQLIEATIQEIGESGSLEVSVSTIARRAGVSSALAFHYFGGKEQLFLAVMRQILTDYAAEVRTALGASQGPRERLAALIKVSFSPSHFRPDVVAAWLNFYVLAQRSPQAKRLLSIYHRRLRSNLLYDLKPLVGSHAPPIARRIAGLIDGLYLRFAINQDDMSGESAAEHVLAALDSEIRSVG